MSTDKTMRVTFLFIFSFFSFGLYAQDVTISDVPMYIWRYGCGPTAEGMVLGYYDTHGFPDLLPGDGSIQTDEINQSLASNEYYYDYAEPIDAAPTLLPDKSELPVGDEHQNNCLADFMGTSQSIKGNYYAWSLPTDMVPAWTNYINYAAPGYEGTGHMYAYENFPWDSLVANINRNRPMVFLVDSDADGIYDHYVTVVGYEISDGVKYYDCLNTWDNTYYHWYPYQKMASGVSFGVLDCFTFEVHFKLPDKAGAISGPTNVCKGVTSVTYTVPVITKADSYVWTLPSGFIGNSNTNSITVSVGTGAVTGQISVYGHNSQGNGTASYLDVEVDDIPGAAGVISGSKTVCQGQSSVTYSVVEISGATSYIWTLPTGASGSSTTNSITVNYGTSATSGNITVIGNSACGGGTSSSLSVTVNQLPSAAGSISGTTTVCQGQSLVTYTVPIITNATTYVWSLPSGATGSSTTRSITVSYGQSAVSGNINVYGTNSCGNGTSSSLAVTVNPLPATAGIISGTTTVCQGQSSVTYTVPVITNATTYVWSLPSGATGSSTTRSITVSYGQSAVSGNISVYGTNSCGNGTSSSLAVTVNPLPVAAGTISGTTTVCQGQTSVTYTVPAITNATSYSWSLPTGATGTSTTRSITVSFGTSAVSGNISVYGTNSCGDGTSSSLAVTVNPTPSSAGTISGSTNVCQGQTSVTYTVPVIANATSYTWTIPSGATGSSNTRSITINYGTSSVSGNISVYGSNSCGNGSASSLIVTVNPLPVLSGTISGETSVCQGETNVIYTVTAIANATSYVWTLPTGASGTSSTNSITVNFGSTAASGNITVKGINSCGESNVASLAITVNPLPGSAGSVSGYSSLCQGQTAVIYSVPSITNATSYVWTLPSGTTGTSSTNSISVNFGTSAVSGNVIVKGSNACGYGPSSSLPVTVNNLPPTPVITLADNTLHSSAFNGNQWYYQSNPILAANNQEYTATSSGDYYVIVTENGCISNTSNIISVILTDVESLTSNSTINIYPNPVSEEITIEKSGNLKSLKIDLLNSSGQIVYKGYIIDKTKIQMSAFSKGLYILRIENGKDFDYRKIIKN